jgi:hypothetical protein
MLAYFRADHVSWKFDIDWTLEAKQGGQHPFSFLHCGLGVIKGRRCNRYFFKDIPLRVKVPHPVVEQWIFLPLPYARSSAYDDDGGLFCVRLRRGVDHL